jgi:ATP-independent RNA helicase DbpA
MNPKTFASLNLPIDLMKSLHQLGYESMTPIQALSLPTILDGKDVIAQAKTGSGKTATFGIGILSQLDTQSHHVQALVLCPTRELADQVTQEIRKLARMIPNIRVLTLCGGVPISVHAASLERTVHIVVGTPGRVEDLLHQKILKMDQLKLLVLDEADRMLDMGFSDSIDAIMSKLPKIRQTLLLSATFSEKIQTIAERVMNKPIKVEVDTTHDETSIAQSFYQVTHNDQRIQALQLLLLHARPESALIFCNTKRETDILTTILKNDGFSALALHGDFEQKERREILVQFANKSISILVATDVAARGLDIPDVDAIFNYEMPRDPEVYIHRIGRTGRAGKSGNAYSMITHFDNQTMKQIESMMGQSMVTSPLPSQDRPNQTTYSAPMITLKIHGGKSEKIRPGDIVGALTGELGILGSEIGDITIFDRCAYVAVQRKVADAAFKKLNEGKLKGRSFQVWRL